MTDSIVSFEKKSKEICTKSIIEDMDAVADSVIEACMTRGRWDYDLAQDLLAPPHLSDEMDGFRKTLLSVTITRIEKKGYRKEAMELRKRLHGNLDLVYEKLMQRAGNYSLTEVPKKTTDEEIYHDVDTFFISMTKEERDRIDTTVKNVFADMYPFSEMNKQEAFDIMKDIAKYAFYHGDYHMKELRIDCENLELSLTFRSRFPLLRPVKDAFAYLMNIFDEMYLTYDEENQMTTAHFDYFSM